MTMRSIALLLCLVLPTFVSAEDLVLRNASYDPTREFYVDYNRMFAAHWRQGGGGDVEVLQTHGGSGAQADAVIAGEPADVVTLALAADVDRIASAGLLDADWRRQMLHGSVPYTSTVVFLVRKGNPKHIADWNDLVGDVQVVTADPKTSGVARWSYLAAWTWAARTYRDGERVLDYMRGLYAKVPVLDRGARGARDTFVERDIGDVLLAWENEALRVLADPQTSQAFEIVYPSISIRAEPVVAVVDRNADAHGVRAVAEAYVETLYTPAAQRLVAQHHFRPILRDGVPPSQLARFRSLPMVTVDEAFGGWSKAQATHFADGGLYDRIRAAPTR
ncbi:sulfate ABC transporter substrate-binding protein [Luteimonas fraxinea]|uniref:sulfate ABC transporter substrate-binding protein n=1 Tax=Luteimonas fraxinea TaxID=2901869 RepID=UPI001E3AF690|nr:sulfate ABC transporter substrate-binding protein [Luteimonas fraxinea]MCD9124736.1 sulfate ABC transporter substrate-binding protein [Luteimonas fraxinea]